MSITERLKQIRLYFNMSRDEFAAPLEVAQGTVYYWEIGRQKVAKHRVAAICESYGVSSEWLENGTGDVFQPGRVPEGFDGFHKDVTGAYTRPKGKVAPKPVPAPSSVPTQPQQPTVTAGTTSPIDLLAFGDRDAKFQFCKEVFRQLTPTQQEIILSAMKEAAEENIRAASSVAAALKSHNNGGNA